jgi:FkbM family methyltransferase
LSKFSKIAQALRSARLTRALALHRVLAGSEHRFVLSTELATVVDVGANRGQFSLAVRQWAPGARVIAFEPLPGPASIFRSVFAGEASVELHQVALGIKPERREMHVSGRDDSSSLLPISATQTSLFPGTAEIGSVEVTTGPLGDFVEQGELRAPAMLKLDVQGFEYDALLGCRTMLPFFQWIYCECSFVELYTGQKLAAEVVALLAENGFSLAGVHNPAYDSMGRCIQADLLFSAAAGSQSLATGKSSQQ